METFEYKKLSTKNKPATALDQNLLNEQAKQGWRVIDVHYAYETNCRTQTTTQSHRVYLLERIIKE